MPASSESNENASRIVTEIFNRPDTQDLLLYESLVQKQDFFGISPVFNSSTEFICFWDDLSNSAADRNRLYRGVSEASYRLFNKAQRAYIAQKKQFFYDQAAYHAAIKSMIQRARELNNHLLSRYFAAFGGSDNDVAVLSFLQHYGAPTPFLDWTSNFDIALYFACSGLSEEEVEYHYSSPGREISDYISVYLLHTESAHAYTSRFRPLSNRSTDNVSYDRLMKKQFVYITEQQKNGKPVFLLGNNPNILSQAGVFIYNSSPFLPLEELLRTHSTLFYMHHQMQGDTTIGKSPINCININKGIVKYIKRILAEKGISEQTVFPDPKSIAERAAQDCFKA